MNVGDVQEVIQNAVQGHGVQETPPLAPQPQQQALPAPLEGPGQQQQQAPAAIGQGVTESAIVPVAKYNWGKSGDSYKAAGAGAAVHPPYQWVLARRAGALDEVVEEGGRRALVHFDEAGKVPCWRRAEAG